jgi:hypothetical protein
MTKKLNVDRITNELEGSAFFSRRDKAAKDEDESALGDVVLAEPPARSKDQAPTQPPALSEAQAEPRNASREQASKQACATASR